MYFSNLLGIILAAHGAFSLPVAEARVTSVDCPMGRNLFFGVCLNKCSYPKDPKTVEKDQKTFNECRDK
jgi:hypothetical protein